MTNKRIIWEQPDGSIAITIPAPKGRRVNEVEEDWIERVAVKAKPSGAIRHPDCNSEDLPKRYFRSCWRYTNLKVDVDMPLARVQKMNEIREKRNKLLDDSDKEHLRLQAVGSAQEKQDMEIYRQFLRDVPSNIDLELIKDSDSLEVFEPIWTK